MKRSELIKSVEFWLTKYQILLFNELRKYLKENKMTQSDFAKEIGVSKGYISQILNGDFDHKLSKFIELSIAIKKAPMIHFESLEIFEYLDSIDGLNLIEDNNYIFKHSMRMNQNNAINFEPHKSQIIHFNPQHHINMSINQFNNCYFKKTNENLIECI